MYLITVDEKGRFSAVPTNKQGGAATLAAPPIWGLSDSQVATLVDQSADGLSITLMPLVAGIVQVWVEGNADLHGGVRLLRGTLDVQVEWGEAWNLVIIPSAPEPK